MADRIILTRSRKAFFLEYIMALIAISILFTISLRGSDVSYVVVILAATAAVIGLAKPEIGRLRDRCIITKEFVTIKRGILNKREHQFHLSTITDFNYRQNLWQRIFKCGTLIIRSFSHAGKEIHVGNIDNPNQVMAAISRLVDRKFEKPESKPLSSAEGQ